VSDAQDQAEQHHHRVKRDEEALGGDEIATPALCQLDGAVDTWSSARRETRPTHLG